MALEPGARPRTKTNPDLWAPGATSETVPMPAPLLGGKEQRARWYQLAREANAAEGDSGRHPITAPTAEITREEEAATAGQDLFGLLLKPEMAGPTRWVTIALLIVGPLAFVFASQMGPRLPAALMLGGALGVLSSWFTAWQVLGKKGGAGLVTAAALGYQLIFSGALAAGGFGAYAVLLVALTISVTLSFIRPWMPLQAGAGALGIAAIVALVTVANGLSARESSLRTELSELAIAEESYCDDDMGICVKAPPGVRLVPGDAPSWVTDALGEDPSSHLIVVASEDGTLFGYIRGERLSRRLKFDVYLEQHTRNLGSPRRADDLLPPALRMSPDYETAAFEFTASGGKEKGIASFVQTKDDRVVTLLAYGPAATYSALSPKLIQLASALRIAEFPVHE